MVTQSARNNRNQLLDAVYTESWGDVKAMLAERPGLSRYLIASLHETDSERLEATLKSFEVIAQIFEIERLRDLARKLLWMLNDESGNHCPNAALAMAHIAYQKYDVIAPHLPVLNVHANDPGDQMAETCTHALSLIAKSQRSKQPASDGGHD